VLSKLQCNKCGITYSDEASIKSAQRHKDKWIVACKKAECLEQVLVHALMHSNINMAKIRTLNPMIEEQHCERCHDIARYHIVPVKFGGDVTPGE
jgi:hypothetical protein